MHKNTQPIDLSALSAPTKFDPTLIERAFHNAIARLIPPRYMSTEPMSSRSKRCGVIAYCTERRDAAIWVLVVEQKRTHDNPGFIGFPKGGMDKGETMQETARREFEEETGMSLARLIEDDMIIAEDIVDIRAANDPGLFLLETSPQVNVYQQYFYMVRLRRRIEVPAASSAEIESVRWARLQDMDTLLTSGTTKKVLANYEFNNCMDRLRGECTPRSTHRNTHSSRRADGSDEPPHRNGNKSICGDDWHNTSQKRDSTRRQKLDNIYMSDKTYMSDHML
jgi:8-oxo-dGTP pyrophosphatase MutT (NUDIX family)